MFDAIDSKKDGVLDLVEWGSSFTNLVNDDPKMAVKLTPYAQWETTLEAQNLGRCIARNRKLLIQQFTKYSTHSDHNGEAKYVTFKQAKKALRLLLKQNFLNSITDEKLETIL